ncbi:hypothetical protein L207DRAFT_641537 [Hyaloscypha variabilis F]|uniref:Clr5 domain-containing protein n=1 Tax=Hyaloscypha variabilis (strain UAMH 11265 / GT02V1 / F) TaxID=1149755 RepID=A0A2J6QWG8_HYAVF|nr:hypothetical protein L207DRAFT_641537 [Hyaloscypha variabilis F]
MSLESTSHSMSNEGQISVNHGTQAMTKQQWDNLKPLIEQIYIEENRPFPYLAEVLRKDHGFEPKKRQFARKIDEWGFRKNISRGERRMILQRVLTHPSEEADDFRDRRLKARKLNNWRKRYRDELQLGTFALGSTRGRIQVTPTSDQTSIREENGNTDHSKGSRDDYPPELNEVREDDSDDISLPDVRQNTFDWSRLDDPGLPGLVPLLTALRLESAATDQSSPLDETEIKDPLCLRNSELQEISSNRPVSVIDSIDSCLLLYRPESEDKHETRNNSPQYPWRSIENVFWGTTTSPLNEIYVFPPSQAPRWTKNANVVNLWASLTEEASKLEMKLAKLEAHFGDHNSAVMAVMEQLSSIYRRLEEYRKAERLQRRLVDIYFQVLGPSNIRTLQAALCVIEILLEQGGFLKAKAESENLLSSILKLVEHDHPLAVSANYIYAIICSGSGRSDEAERYCRQHLQIMLSLHGPKAVPTIRAMTFLCSEIYKRAPKEAKILIRIASQLVVELPTVDETPCRVFRNIIMKLSSLGAHEESYQMATKLMINFLFHWAISIPRSGRRATDWLGV